MNRGFVLIAIDTDQDNMRNAYAAASSIKLCDPNSSICVITDKNVNVPKIYEKVFDYHTELPFGNTAYKDGFHGMNIWQLIHATPYDETIYVDYDTLFLNVDIETLWDSLSEYEIAIPKTSRSYRDTLINPTHLFEYESTYEFPELFNNFIYFKKGAQLAIDWFKMADPMFQNWRDLYKLMMPEKKPSTFNKNVIANIVTHMLGEYDNIACNVNNLYDLDIHSQWLWNNDVPDDWTDVLNYWFPENKKLIIENHFITSGIIHYRNETFLTDEILNEYRTQINISSKQQAAA